MKNVIIAILLVVIVILVYFQFGKTNALHQFKFEKPDFSSTDLNLDSLSSEFNKRAEVYKELISEMLQEKVPDSNSIDCGTTLTPSQYDEITGSLGVCTPEHTPGDVVKMITYPLIIRMVVENQNTVTITNEEVQ